MVEFAMKLRSVIALSAVAASILACAVPAHASVEFSITPSASSVELQDWSTAVTVDFTAASPYSGVNTPSTVLLGVLSRSILPLGIGNDTKNFDLGISQTAPSIAGGTYDGSLSAAFRLIGANVSVQFANTAITLGGITYTLALDSSGTPWEAGKNYDIPGFGFRPIYAVITGNANVPEPMTLAVWGVLGLCGSAIAWRTKNKQ